MSEIPPREWPLLVVGGESELERVMRRIDKLMEKRDEDALAVEEPVESLKTENNPSS